MACEPGFCLWPWWQLLGGWWPAGWRPQNVWDNMDQHGKLDVSQSRLECVGRNEGIGGGWTRGVSRFPWFKESSFLPQLLKTIENWIAKKISRKETLDTAVSVFNLFIEASEAREASCFEEQSGVCKPQSAAFHQLPWAAMCCHVLPMSFATQFLVPNELWSPKSQASTRPEIDLRSSRVEGGDFFLFLLHPFTWLESWSPKGRVFLVSCCTTEFGSVWSLVELLIQLVQATRLNVVFSDNVPTPQNQHIVCIDFKSFCWFMWFTFRVWGCFT